MTEKSFRTLKLTVQVELLAGEHIDHAIPDLIEMAKRLGCGVTASFNGLHLCAFPHTTVEEKRRSYDVQFADSIEKSKRQSGKVRAQQERE